MLVQKVHRCKSPVTRMTDLDLWILLVLDSHDSAIFSPSCHLKILWHAVFCNHQAVISGSKKWI